MWKQCWNNKDRAGKILRNFPRQLLIKTTKEKGETTHMENKNYILPSRAEFKAPISRAAMGDLAGLCHIYLQKS